MQKFSSHPASSLLRKVLILGVLAGLIFSCAEGIRLLPFPPPGAADGADSFRPSAAGAAHLSYIKSFESGRGNMSSRSKRSLDNHFFGNPPPASIPPFRVVSGALGVSLAFTLVSHSSRFARQLPDTRGPPVFFSI